MYTCRMGVKLLALLAFSPLFIAKACIDLVSNFNQYLLDYLPGAHQFIHLHRIDRVRL